MRRSWPAGSNAWNLAGLLLILAMCILVAVQWQATTAQADRLAEPDHRDNAWQTYRLQTEFHRFDADLLALSAGRLAPDALLQRQQILSSRVGPLLAATAQDNLPGFRPRLARLHDTIDSWGREIAAWPAGPRGQAAALALEARVRAAAPDLQSLIQDVHDAQTRRTDAARIELRTHLEQLARALQATGAGIAAFVGILLVRQRRAHRTRRALNALNSTLELKVAQRTRLLDEQQQLLGMILASSPAGVLLVRERDGFPLFVNAIMRTRLGLADDVTAIDIGQLFADLECAARIAARLAAGELLDKVEAPISAGNRTFWGLVSGQRILFDTEPCTLLWIDDISDRKQLENRLREQAALDGLTGTYNRRAFFEILEQHMAMSASGQVPLAIMVIDVDHFKHINDNHGHPVGDLALRHLVRTAWDTLRAGDTLGRLGGEEFAVILPATDLQQASQIAERLRHNIDTRPVHRPDQPDLLFTVSIGVTTVTTDDTVDVLLARADAALYLAKRSGRNRACSSAELPEARALQPRLR